MRRALLAAALLAAACNREAARTSSCGRWRWARSRPVSRSRCACSTSPTSATTPTQQAVVAEAMASWSRSHPLDLVLSPGDNVYECGPDPLLPGAASCAFGPDQNTVSPGYVPPVDRASRSSSRSRSPACSATGSPSRCCSRSATTTWPPSAAAAAGARSERVWPAVAPASRWPTARRAGRCPGRHWVHDQGPARFIGIDSNLLQQDYGGFSFDDEVAFVAEAARPCGEKLCFVVAHHPSVSGGEHRADVTPEYLARVKRIEQAAGPIAGWLSGHEHQLEHLRAPAGYDVLDLRQQRARPAQRSASRPSPPPAPGSSSPRRGGDSACSRSAAAATGRTGSSTLPGSPSSAARLLHGVRAVR